VNATVTSVEILDSKQPAVRLNLPESWIRNQVRSRATDPIPCLRFGRYVRFSWGHPELMIQRVLRHANVSVTQTHYIKTVDADAVAAMDALEVSIAGHSRKAAVIVPPHVN